MVSPERREYLDYLWGDETSDPESWEWRDELDEEERALVESWDQLYAQSVADLSRDILSLTERRRADG